MTTYRIKITGDRYPTDYTVQASNWGTAISRAVKEWRKRFKGNKTKELRVHAVKIGQLLTANGGESDD